jgi:hypothetical protein
MSLWAEQFLDTVGDDCDGICGQGDAGVGRSGEVGTSPEVYGVYKYAAFICDGSDALCCPSHALSTVRAIRRPTPGKRSQSGEDVNQKRLRCKQQIQ